MIALRLVNKNLFFIWGFFNKHPFSRGLNWG